MHTDKRNAYKISDKKPCIQRCTCEIKRAVEGWNLNATRRIKLYVDWVDMVIYSQIKSTCNKDGEANILSHLPGVCGKKKVCKYQKYLNKTAWSYPHADGRVNTHTPPPSDPSSVSSRSSALNCR